MSLNLPQEESMSLNLPREELMSLNLPQEELNVIKFLIKISSSFLICFYLKNYPLFFSFSILLKFKIIFNLHECLSK